MHWRCGPGGLRQYIDRLPRNLGYWSDCRVDRSGLTVQASIARSVVGRARSLG